MAQILRGDIRWAEPNPAVGAEQAGRRPVLILSRDEFNERSGTVIAVALTSRPQRMGYPFSVELNSIDLPRKSWVKVSQIRTLFTQRIGERLSCASALELDRVIDGLNEIIGRS